MIDFNKMPTIYWNNTTKMEYLQRRIIIYSIMYYELSESCVTDKFFDGISKQLVNLMKHSTNEQCEKTHYWYAMHDFDGTTGFDIPDRLNKEDRMYLTTIAKYICKQWREQGGHVLDTNRSIKAS